MNETQTGRATRPIEVPMSDGATLAAVRHPGARSPGPVLVSITPYHKDAYVHSLFHAPVLGAGYELVLADVRGFGGSTGPYEGLLSPREIADGVELLEWVAEQDFCDGRTALIGASYSGINQLLIAARRPRGLVCIAPAIAMVDVYRDGWRRGGILANASWGSVTYTRAGNAETTRRGLEEFYTQIAVDPWDGPRFRERSAEGLIERIDVPVLCSGGWYDHFVRATIRAFQAVRAPKRLVVGNWSHEPLPPEPGREELLRWLAYWLRDEGEDPTRAGANVALSCIRSDDWQTLGAWPATGEIAWQRWNVVEAPTEIAVVPLLDAVAPTSTSHVAPPIDLVTDSGMRTWGEAWTADLPAAETETHLLGPVALIADLTTADCRDLDLHARLSIVQADGSVHQVTEGRLRASHREVDPARSQLTADGEIAVPWHPHERAEPLAPGEPATLHVEIAPVHLRLAPGEQLRLGITLVRADDASGPATATLLPGTRVLLPRA